MDIQFWIEHSGSLFHQIFMIVMGGLYGMAFLFGSTYKVVNILVYFILIPSSWIYLIGRKTSVWLNSISVVGLVTFFLFPNLSENCDYLFERSVDFLNYTAEIFGSNYINMSVYICVVVVGLVYLVLLPLTLSRKTTKLIFGIGLIFTLLYLILIYPFFKDIMVYALEKREHLLS
ncbi:hypothetical protein OO009_04660 [Flavobacteriaceae bacterium KMM 6897]|nr:hypothetical protein [Flavobacteriaceae bacterium KMM 6897]